MQKNLVDSNIVTLSGPYWSSTDYPIGATYHGTWDQFFTTGNKYQDLGDKDAYYNVRCVRALTP